MLDVKEQLKILLLHLRQAPGGELGSATPPKASLSIKSTQGVDPLTKLDLDLLLKVANHLQKSQFVELAKTGGLTRQDYDRLQWWAQDYQASQQAALLSSNQTKSPQLVSSTQVKAEVQVQNGLTSEVAREGSGNGVATIPDPTRAKDGATLASPAAILDHAINKVYHRQKLAMIVPLAIKLRQIKGGEIKVAALDEGYLGLLQEFNQQATSLSQPALSQFGRMSGLGERDLVRLLWLRNEFNKQQVKI